MIFPSPRMASLSVAFRRLPPMRLKALFFQRARLRFGVAPSASAAKFRPVGGGLLGCCGTCALFASAAKIDDFAFGFAHDPVQKVRNFLGLCSYLDA
jgi:hypothetical protein